jgi:3-oxoacyl-ACP reductase-like protein
MSRAHPFDASIPVLTEVLDEKPEATVPEAAPAPAPAAVSAPAAAPAPTMPDSAALDLEQLEQRLSERILHQLQSRVDFVLEQRIRDSMEEVLSHALRGLTNEIRNGLHDTLSRIVTRAVAQELTHLQAQKK